MDHQTLSGLQGIGPQSHSCRWPCPRFFARFAVDSSVESATECRKISPFFEWEKRSQKSENRWDRRRSHYTVIGGKTTISERAQIRFATVCICSLFCTIWRSGWLIWLGENSKFPDFALVCVSVCPWAVFCSISQQGLQCDWNYR